jgi:hypothetical protein
MPASLIILANRLEYMSVSKGNAYVKAHGKIHDNQYITEEMPLHGIIYVRQFMYCVSIGVLKYVSVNASVYVGICFTTVLVLTIMPSPDMTGQNLRRAGDTLKFPAGQVRVKECQIECLNRYQIECQI